MSQISLNFNEFRATFLYSRRKNQCDFVLLLTGKAETVYNFHKTLASQMTGSKSRKTELKFQYYFVWKISTKIRKSFFRMPPIPRQLHTEKKKRDAKGRQWCLRIR